MSQSYKHTVSLIPEVVKSIITVIFLLKVPVLFAN